MATPIVRIRDVLVVPVQEDLGDDEVMSLQSRLAQALEDAPAQGVLIDLTLVETIDSYLGRTLNEIAVGARLLGAKAVVVGMQPAVAITLVELGLELKGVRTALNVDRGFELFQRTDGRRRGRAGI